jgi:hypothetical protein
LSVLIDSCVWSQALRRKVVLETSVLEELLRLLSDEPISVPGIVRMEVLSGIASQQRFRQVREELGKFPMLRTSGADYDLAAEYFNKCMAGGVQPTTVDMLITALAVRRKMRVFTTDHDFLHYAKHLPVKLHRADLTYPNQS